MALVTDENLLSSNACIHFVTDQSTWDRIRIGSYLNRATCGDMDTAYQIIGIEPQVWQFAKFHLLLRKSILPMTIGICNQFFHESNIVLTTSEFATTT